MPCWYKFGTPSWEGENWCIKVTKTAGPKETVHPVWEEDNKVYFGDQGNWYMQLRGGVLSASSKISWRDYWTGKETHAWYRQDKSRLDLLRDEAHAPRQIRRQLAHIRADVAAGHECLCNLQALCGVQRLNILLEATVRCRRT